MIYKIAAVVLAVALCIVPVFASSEEEYLCEEHGCLSTDVPDAVCSVCLGYAVDEIVSGNDVTLTSDAGDSVSVLSLIEDTSLFYPNKYFEERELVQELRIWGSMLSSMRYGIYTSSVDYAFAYSPVREAFVASVGGWTSVSFYPAGSGAVDTGVGIDMTGLTTHMVVRFTDTSGSYLTSADLASPRYTYSWARLASKELSSGGVGSQPLFYDQYYWLFSPVLSSTTFPVASMNVLDGSGGYLRLWVSQDVYKPDVVNSSVFDDVSQEYFFASGFRNSVDNAGIFSLRLGSRKAISTIEVKVMDVYRQYYDVVNNSFPAGFSSGGVVPGTTYPYSPPPEQVWIDDEFADGVNPDLSGTANSVDGNIDTLQGFETQVHADLDRYLNESGISNYTIPSSLGSAFAWVSDKFTSFINVNGELKTIILFPAYLGILVAMVHGLEFAGRTLSHKARKGGGDG